MELVDTSWLTKKSKQPAMELAKTVIALNGMFATTLGIAGLVPQVQRYLTGNKSLDAGTNINMSLFFGSTLYLGISNIASLMSLDVGSTFLQLNANVIGYVIYSAIGSYYYYKVSKNSAPNAPDGTGYTRNFWYVTGAMTGISIFSSLAAISRLKSTFSTTQLFTMRLKSGGKRKRARSSSDPKTQQVEKVESKAEEAVEDPNGGGTYERDTNSSFRAAGYKFAEMNKNTITLMQVINEDDMGGSESLGTMITESENCNFKVESNKDQFGGKGYTPNKLELIKNNKDIFPIRAFIMEKCRNVSCTVSYVYGPVNMVNCENCEIFITHAVSVIEIAECKNVKISILKNALNIYEEWEYCYRDSDKDETVKRSVKSVEIGDGVIQVDNEPQNVTELTKEESKNIVRYMNNKKCNEKWRLLKRSVNQPSISVAVTSSLELSINYFGNTKPLDVENENWMDYNVPYRASATLDLANGKASMKFDML